MALRVDGNPPPPGGGGGEGSPAPGTPPGGPFLDASLARLRRSAAPSRGRFCHFGGSMGGSPMGKLALRGSGTPPFLGSGANFWPDPKK